MKPIVSELVVVFLVSLGSSTCVVAQSIPVDRFLQGVSAHSTGEQAEKDHSLALDQALNIASPAEVERVLPALLLYSRASNEIHAREYAIGFLLSIAIRLDGGDLLASHSEEISSLLVDANPRIQDEAIAVINSVMRKPANIQQYVPAMLAAMQEPQTPQEVCVVSFRCCSP